MPSESSRALFLCYHFFPSPEVGAKRATALAGFLELQGSGPIVVSAFEGADQRTLEMLAQRFPQSVFIPNEDGGDSLIGRIVAAKRWLRRRGSAGSPAAARIATAQAPPKQGRNSVLYRLFFAALHVIDDKKRWSARAAQLSVKAIARHDVKVIFASGPPMSSLAAAIRAGRRARIPVVVDFRDPCYVGAAAPGASWINRVDGRLRKRFESWVVRNADAIVCTSPSLGVLLKRRYAAASDRIVCISNGFDNAPAPPAPTGGRLEIVFAGALYVNRDPFPFLEVLSELLRRPNIDTSRIRVTFVGECDSYRGINLHKWIKGRNIENVVRILPKVPTEALRSIYEEATVLLNLAQGQPMQIPAKTFEQLASGRELLLICEQDSDTARIVRGIRGIHQIAGNDHEGMLSILHELYGRHVREQITLAPGAADISMFSRAEQNQRLLALLQQTAARKR